MLRVFILTSKLLLACIVLLSVAGRNGRADERFSGHLQPLLKQHCYKCHGGGKGKPKGKINFLEIKTFEQLTAKPKLLKEMIDAIDANDMPPEDAPQLEASARLKLLSTLKDMLREATAGKKAKRAPPRRLNRFQYNNSVKDLFALNKDVFWLPEKLMTRHGNYLASTPGKMPNTVAAECRSMAKTGGMNKVEAFPQDLRAEHGFDNQADQLTLPPILLDAFLKLSVSILDSPDFNEKTCGIWNDFFKEPASGGKTKEEIKKRLGPFLKRAFRSPVDDATLDRYADYAMGKMNQGLSFTDSMKKVASAALSSPLFLFRYREASGKEAQYELASKLSFFLWGSIPDAELMDLAEAGTLSQPEVLKKTIDRMFADKKIERFLDSFPSQWLQLENTLEAVPDPKKYRLFNLVRGKPASLHMVLEPLLLFDAVFVEDRPIIELISPTFSYRNEYLKKWYALSPPVNTDAAVEAAKQRAQIQAAAKSRSEMQTKINKAKTELIALVKPVRAKLLEARKKASGAKKAVDLKPYAAWEFNGNLKDAVSSLELKAHGKISYKDGMVVLNNAYLQSKNLSIDLKAKTMEVWLKLQNVKQRGGGAMTIQGQGDFFDSIVLGEIKGRHWISGSNGHVRTKPFPGSTPESKANEMLHLVMVYQADGTTTLYRNGKPYGKPFRKGSTSFPKNRTSVVFGVRHLPAGRGKHLAITLDKARLYNRALSAGEVAASNSGTNLFVTDGDVVKALSASEKGKKFALDQTIRISEIALKNTPTVDENRKLFRGKKKNQENEFRRAIGARSFTRVALDDPRYGGVITNAAILSMTSAPHRTKPITRGSWVIEVIFNDPPPPPPNDVPPLDEDAAKKSATIRETFAQHRENPTCAGCHTRIDPLGFALENFDVVGQWRDTYENGRDVDSSGKLLRKYEFKNAIGFKESLVKEKKRFAKAFTGHLLRFALSRELTAVDSITLGDIVEKTEKDNFKMKLLIKEVILTKSFSGVQK
jgi:hypothetical protein